MNGTIEGNEIIQILNGKIKTIPKVDTTLTQPGMSADAKITGDKIKELNDKIDELNQAIESLR